jgi:hypothetical protein
MGYFASSIDINIQRQIENAVAAGRAYYVSTGKYSATAGGAWCGISVFWTARATKIIVLGARSYDLTANVDVMLRKTTTDPALSGHAISGIAITNPLNSSVGGGNLTSSTEAISSATGTLHRGTRTSANATVPGTDILQEISDYIIIPQGVAGGVLLISNSASADVVNQELRWVEL